MLPRIVQNGAEPERPMTSIVDLDAYFKRIAYDGSRGPTLPVLHAVTRAHTQAIAFENIDVLLGRRISLQVPCLFDKLVRHQRGGYCFESNGLLLQVLQQLGFRARALGGRVRLRVADRGVLPRRTHMLIVVCLDDALWLTDVGIGAASLTSALRLVPDQIQHTPHGRRRLQRTGSRWFHQEWHRGRWRDIYEFTLEDFPLVDRQLANWYTSTCPEDHFSTHLSAALARADGSRLTLSNRHFSRHYPDGSHESRELPRDADFLATLEQQMGIVLSVADGQRLARKIRPEAPAP